MIGLDAIKETRVYREHFEKAQASLDRLRARLRRRRLISFPIALAVGVFIGYNVAILNAPWATELCSFIHGPYFLPILLFAGVAFVYVKAGQRYRGLLDLQSRLSRILVATNLLHTRKPDGSSPLEGI